jgi:hypothetical protein
VGKAEERRARDKERLEFEFKVGRRMTTLTLVLIVLVGVAATSPFLFRREESASAWMRISVAGSIAGALFAAFMTFIPIKSYFIKLKVPELDGRLETLETVRLANSLWLFVFSFGTTAAVLASPIYEQPVSLKEIFQLGTRLFVSWFLSILTMVATRLIGRLDALQRSQESLQGNLVEAEKVVEGMTAGIEKTREVAEGTIRTAANSIDLQREYGELKALEAEMRLGGVRSNRGPTEHFTEAARTRLNVMNRLSKKAKIRVANPANPNDEIGEFLRFNILLPALLPYLATDPWREGEGIAVIQEASYLLYAQFIESIFREIIRVIQDNEPGCFGKKFQGRCIEVFTTLDVPPSHFYNVIGPLNEPSDEAPGVRFDDATTEESWEYYRAIQAAAIWLGRTTGRFAVTRCFVASSKGAVRAIDAELLYSFVPWQYLESHGRVAKKVEKSPNDKDGILPFIQEELKQFERSKWKDVVAGLINDDVRSALQTIRAAPEGTSYSYPILIETPRRDSSVPFDPNIVKFDPKTDSLDPKKWCSLPLHFIENHLTSQQRGLIIYDQGDTLRLPKDIFAVGWSKNFSLKPPENLEIAFIVTLQADERGTRNVTQVLTPLDGDIFLKLQENIKQLASKSPVSCPNGQADRQAVEIFDSARLDKLKKWINSDKFRFVNTVFGD